LKGGRRAGVGGCFGGGVGEVESLVGPKVVGSGGKCPGWGGRVT